MSARPCLQPREKCLQNGVIKSREKWEEARQREEPEPRRGKWKWSGKVHWTGKQGSRSHLMHFGEFAKLCLVSLLWQVVVRAQRTWTTLMPRLLIFKLLCNHMRRCQKTGMIACDLSFGKFMTKSRLQLGLSNKECTLATEAGVAKTARLYN